jgi:signal transduction histidine kinase
MGVDGAEVRFATKLARRSLQITFGAIFILLCLLLAERWHFQSSFIKAADKITKAENIKGRILLADEQLTMSAIAYAESGDKVWHQRYLEKLPEIDAAIADAKALASPEVSARFDEETRVANDELVKLEMKSFELVGEGKLIEAAAIFPSAPYRENKQILADGSDRFLAGINADLETALQNTKWLGLSLIALVAALGTLGFYIIWNRLTKALAASEAAFLETDAHIRAELTEAHQKNLRKDRMAQLGQLTATVAHDLRSPLGAVRTSAFLLRRKLMGKDLGVENALERIESGILRCDEIISQLLDYSRNSSPQKSEHDLDAWLAEQLDEHVQMLPASVELELEQGLDGRKVSFDPGRLQRAIINLVQNASEAMVGKTGEKENDGCRPPKIAVSTSLTRRGLEIAVTDTGPGISEDNLAKIMDPLFTTKSFGTGLGLSAVQKIFEQHGGGLDVKSVAGQGATFTGWFPLDGTATIKQPDLARQAA